MKKLAKVLIIILLGMVMIGCAGDGTPQPVYNALDTFDVKFIFEMPNGMKMYRFYDNGKYHYFTTRGETISNVPYGKSSDSERIESH